MTKVTVVAVASIGYDEPVIADSWYFFNWNMFSNAKELGLEDERIATLRRVIRRTFPVIAHEGKITNCDGAWLPELTEENAIHDDDKFVHEALKGRTWPDISQQFLKEEPDGFVLLTDEAFVAYLAAWLLCSLDDMGGENIVREFVIYSFSPSHDQIPDMTPEKLRRLKLLNREQREALHSLLMEFAERERSSFVKKKAASAVELIGQI